MYTDGSKQNRNNGGTVIGENIEIKFLLPKPTSIFTAEAYGIYKTSELINRPKEENKFVIYTDF